MFKKKKKLTKDQVRQFTTGSHKVVAWRCPTHDQTYEMVVYGWARGGTKCTRCQLANRAANSTKPAIGESDPKIQARFEKEFDEKANKKKRLKRINRKSMKALVLLRKNQVCLYVVFPGNTKCMVFPCVFNVFRKLFKWALGGH